MILTRGTLHVSGSGIPRESGDDPPILQGVTSGYWYSPRERG